MGFDPRGVGQSSSAVDCHVNQETEGLFAETAGGTVVASARRLAQAGVFADGEPVVLQISGQGMKTVEALQGRPPFAAVIDGRLADFEAFWNTASGATLTAALPSPSRRDLRGR